MWIHSPTGEVCNAVGSREIAFSMVDIEGF